jgi:hypothetical protein
MSNYITEHIKKKYKNKALIIPTYASAKKEYYSIDDLVEFEQVKFYLGEVRDHEADITPLGIDFFKEVYSLEKLANLLYENQWYSDEFDNPTLILDWLKWWDVNPRK